MSGRATLTTVTSSSNMNVAIETSRRVHHLRSMRRNPREPATSARRPLDGQVAELLAYSVVEARAWELGEAAYRVGEVNVQSVAWD